MDKESEKKKLRLVDEGQTEEVLRLGEKGRGPEVVERILVPPNPEDTERLQQAGDAENSTRRSVEPDIDSILEREAIEDEEWMSEKKPVPYAWFLLIFLGIVALSLVSLEMIRRSKDGIVADARKTAVEKLEENEQEDLESAALVASVENALSRYLSAESVEDLLPLVREPERVRPLMDDWYAKHPIETRKFDGLGVFHPLTLEGRLFWLITCLVEGESPETILMEQTEDGRVLVDWEAQVCYQPISWDDYAARRPEGEELDFRVYLQPDAGGFYSHEFRDEDEWVVYRLVAKGSDEYLFGYARRGSALNEHLEKLVKANRGYPVAAFLRLLIPEGTSSPRGVVIREILSERWALVEPFTSG